MQLERMKGTSTDSSIKSAIVSLNRDKIFKLTGHCVRKVTTRMMKAILKSYRKVMEIQMAIKFLRVIPMIIMISLLTKITTNIKHRKVVNTSKAFRTLHLNCKSPCLLEPHKMYQLKMAVAISKKLGKESSIKDKVFNLIWDKLTSLTTLITLPEATLTMEVKALLVAHINSSKAQDNYRVVCKAIERRSKITATHSTMPTIKMKEYPLTLHWVLMKESGAMIDMTSCMMS